MVNWASNGMKQTVALLVAIALSGSLYIQKQDMWTHPVILLGNFGAPAHPQGAPLPAAKAVALQQNHTAPALPPVLPPVAAPAAVPQPSPSAPSPVDLNSPKYRCQAYGDLTEFCVHRNSLCLIGGKLRVLSTADKGPVPVQNGLSDGFLHLEKDPLFKSPFPYRAMVRAAEYMHPRVASQPGTTWAEGTAVIAGVDAANYNLFHFASNILPFFTYRMRENPDYKSILQKNTSPFTSAIIFGRNSDWTDWQSNIFSIATGLSTSNVTFENTVAKLGNVCFRNAVIGGQSLNMFQGTFDAQIWRRVISTSYGVKFEKRDVVIFKRDKRRLILNGDEVRQLAHKVFGESKVKQIVFWNEPFLKQLEVMCKAGVLISTHGSNSNHAIYMPGGGW